MNVVIKNQFFKREVISNNLSYVRVRSVKYIQILLRHLRVNPSISNDMSNKWKDGDEVPFTQSHPVLHLKAICYIEFKKRRQKLLVT